MAAPRSSDIPPFPRTPYPFDQPVQHSARALESISEWLELNRDNYQQENDNFNVEALALTPEEWLACNGGEDDAWVVGGPDWMNEGNGVSTMAISAGRPISPCTGSTTESTGTSDLYSPEDRDTDGSAEAATTSRVGEVMPPAEHKKVGPPLPRGTVRRRSIGSVAECQLPERKRPRLDRLIIDGTQQQFATPRLLTPAEIISYGRTPVSPAREFSRILAERKCKDGVMYKVVWRESWVHESKLPSVEPIKQAQLMQWGYAWDVISPTGRAHGY